MLSLERKAFGLLAYLAVEGATGRSRIAGLLWPESGEQQARANLRQTLARIRRHAPDLVGGDDPIQLQGVHVDVLHHKARALVGRLSSFSGDARILPHFDFSDCPEFGEWLRGASESLRLLLCAALEKEVERRLGWGHVQSAIEPAGQLVRLDPLSEQAHRRLIGLHTLQGDRPASRSAPASMSSGKNSG